MSDTEESNKVPVIQAFAKLFSAAVSDSDAFDKFLEASFGQYFDGGMAESLRTRTLTGDFGW